MMPKLQSAFRLAAVFAFLFAPGFAAHVRAQAPAGKEIADVVIQGNALRPAEHILSQVVTRPGKTYSQVTLDGDVQRLTAKGWFQNVTVATQKTPDDKVVVIFQVVELKNVVSDIQYRGAQHLSVKELDTLSGLRKGMANSPVSNRMAAQAITRKYQEAGRPFASVKIVEGEKADDTRVIFDIVEGPVVKVSHVDVKFVGEPSGVVSRARVKTQLQTSSHMLRIGGEYNPMMVEGDVAKLQEYYKSLGFLAARVSRELIWAEDHRSVAVYFHVQEGPRYKVAKVQVDGAKVYDEKQILSLSDMKENEYFDKGVVTADIKRIRDFYGYSGRQVGIREEMIETKPGEVLVRYQVEEREPARVGRVIVSGNEVTRDNVILRQVPLYPGQILSYPDMLRAEENLARTGLFDDEQRPQVTVLNPDDKFQDILVKVKEKPTGRLMFGAGVNSDAGVTGSVVLNEQNFDPFRFPTSWEDILEGRAFRGRGQEFRLEAVPGTQVQRYSVSWREPSLFDGPYSLGASGYYFTRNYNGYDESRLGGRVNLGRRLNDYWSVNAAFRAEQVDVYNIPYNAPPEIYEDAGKSALYGFRGGINRDTRDSYLRPTSGSVLDLSYEQIIGTYKYPLMTAEYTNYMTTYQRADGSGRHVLAFRSQASFTTDEAPVYERFYAGGFRSMRGFQFRGVGPFVNGYNVGGDFAFMNSLEYQIPIAASDKLFFVSFIDTGTVERNVDIKNYRVTAGVGLRISVPQLFGPVPLALDFGFPINQAPGDQKQVFSFWLGFFN